MRRGVVLRVVDVAFLASLTKRARFCRASARWNVEKFRNATDCRAEFLENNDLRFFRKTLDLASVDAYNRSWRRFVALLTFGFVDFVNRFKINELKRKRNERSNESAGNRFLPGADARRD